MAETFETLGLNPPLIEGLRKAGITKPTEIQQTAIPYALKNQDIIGQSHTGSGKTLAYLLPLFQKIDPNKREMQAIILAPTYELVMQIDKEIKALGENSGVPVTSIALIGNVNITRQIEKLRDKPHIIVGSTGRILELIKKRKINVATIKTIVIDEGDRLLDDDNLASVKGLVKSTMRDRQLMVFSANIDAKARDAARELMKEPQVITINQQQLINPQITHWYFTAERRDKLELLRKLVAAIQPAKAIIFLNRNEDVQVTTTKLQFHNYKAYGLLGKADKEERKLALEGFRKGDIQLLVASDIAARGLDIQGLTHIFNFDLPLDTKEYLNRVGRTGRSGKAGMALSIVTEKERYLLKKLERKYRITIEEKTLSKGFIRDKP
jgi:ATP-dependent RNA helicase DeaD